MNLYQFSKFTEKSHITEVNTITIFNISLRNILLYAKIHIWESLLLWEMFRNPSQYRNESLPRQYFVAWKKWENVSQHWQAIFFMSTIPTGKGIYRYK